MVGRPACWARTQLCVWPNEQNFVCVASRLLFLQHKLSIRNQHHTVFLCRQAQAAASQRQGNAEEAIGQQQQNIRFTNTIYVN